MPYFCSVLLVVFFFFSSRRRHTRLVSDWSSDVCSSDLTPEPGNLEGTVQLRARRIALILLALTALNCAFQIAWFWRFRGHNITMDGINYIGLARHLLDGDFTASLHGYWSPLLTWIIAAGSLLTHDFTLLAQVITIASFLLCLPLLYLLTFELWQSHLSASLAVFWFSMARAVIASPVATIQADFLFLACSLLYFVRLPACLRDNTRLNWFLLGAIH